MSARKVTVVPVDRNGKPKGPPREMNDDGADAIGWALLAKEQARRFAERKIARATMAGPDKVLFYDDDTGALVEREIAARSTSTLELDREYKGTPMGQQDEAAPQTVVNIKYGSDHPSDIGRQRAEPVKVAPRLTTTECRAVIEALATQLDMATMNLEDERHTVDGLRMRIEAVRADYARVCSTNEVMNQQALETRQLVYENLNKLGHGCPVGTIPAVMKLAGLAAECEQAWRSLEAAGVRRVKEDHAVVGTEDTPLTTLHELGIGAKTLVEGINLLSGQHETALTAASAAGEKIRKLERKTKHQARLLAKFRKVRR